MYQSHFIQRLFFFFNFFLEEIHVVIAFPTAVFGQGESFLKFIFLTLKLLLFVFVSSLFSRARQKDAILVQTSD